MLLPVLHVYLASFSHAIFDIFSLPQIKIVTRSLEFLHGFCQQIRLEHGQVQDWYPNEKMVVVLVSLNDRWCSSDCVGVVSY